MPVCAKKSRPRPSCPPLDPGPPSCQRRFAPEVPVLATGPSGVKGSSALPQPGCRTDHTGTDTDTFLKQHAAVPDGTQKLYGVGSCGPIAPPADDTRQPLPVYAVKMAAKGAVLPQGGGYSAPEQRCETAPATDKHARLKPRVSRYTAQTWMLRRESDGRMTTAPGGRDEDDDGYGLSFRFNSGDRCGHLAAAVCA